MSGETEREGGSAVVDIGEMFRPDGPIARAFPRFEFREGQVELARAIQAAMEGGRRLVAEAGTGTGKSLAYLLAALLSGRRTVVSTGTIALQEQLLNQDIPQLELILGRPIKAALYKGLGNYFCRYRYEDEMETLSAGGEVGAKRRKEAGPDEARTLRAIGAWAAESAFGDKADLPFAVEPATWSNVAASGDDCLGNACAFFCHSDNAHSRLQDAELVVTNHALLALDVAAGFALVPGGYEQLVIDEAHRFPDFVTGALTYAIHNTSLRRLVARLRRRAGLSEILLFEAALAADELFGYFTLRADRKEDRYPLPDDPEIQARAASLAGRLKKLRQALAEVTAPPAGQDSSPEKHNKVRANLDRQLGNYAAALDALRPRYGQLASASELTARAERSAGDGDEFVSWVEHEGTRCTLKVTPLDVSGYLTERLFGAEELLSVIMTSATLATSDSADADGFRFFAGQVGLPDDATCLRFPSPFDYSRQMLLYTTPRLPEPNHPDYLRASAAEIAGILELTRGRAFVLCTSRAAMRYYHAALAGRFNARHQDEMGRGRLLKWFVGADDPVLFATASFWEGISVEGAQLSCIIIDRVPFTSPGDPVYEARCSRIGRAAEDGWAWFQQLAVPQAAVRLRQGVGRLIRTRDDRGLVAILDSRLHRKGYGKLLLRALPPATHAMRLDADLVARFVAPAQSPQALGSD